MVSVLVFGLTSLPGRQLLRILTAIVNGRYDDTVYLGNLPNTPQPATPSSNSLGPLPAVSRIRFVDSSLPALSYFPPHMTALLGDVDFRHGNLLSADFVRSCLADGPWDIVINVSAEKRPELAPAMYTQRTETQAQVIANAVMSAPGCNTQAFVQLSSGRVYPGREPDSPGSVETDEVDAEYMFPYVRGMFMAEEALMKIEGLPLVLVRASLVYGPGDTVFYAPLLIAAEIYKRAGQPMVVPFDPTMPASMIHAYDMARAILALGWWRMSRGQAENNEATPIFNVADDGDSTNQDICNAISTLYKIDVIPISQQAFASLYLNQSRDSSSSSSSSVGIQLPPRLLNSNSSSSQLSAPSMDSESSPLTLEQVLEVIDSHNSALVSAWCAISMATNIKPSALTPYMDPGLLLYICANGVRLSTKKLHDTIEIKWVFPHMTEERGMLAEVVEDYQTLGVWPPTATATAAATTPTESNFKPI